MRTKIVILMVFAGIMFSCKNNQDGYSDEIETNITPVDSSKKKQDTSSVNDNAKNVANPHGTTSGNSTSGSQSSAGTGSGPGESSQDGSTYTIATGVQKDSVRPEEKDLKNKKKKLPAK